MNIEKTLLTSGQRLKRARVLAGINTRREFQKKYKISANTLQGWEQDKNPLSKKGAKRLIEAFKHEGLLCTIEWLIHGKGMPPRPLEMSGDNSNGSLLTPETTHESVLKEEETIYEETQLFKKNNGNTIILNVCDNSMEPYYFNGDYIGGIRIPHSELNQYFGNFCIVELENNLILPRIIHPGIQNGTYTLSCTNPKTSVAPLNFYNVKVISAAPVLWHRRKLMTIKNKITPRSPA
jgi:SOS-response transcriptional repressor LexA